MLVLKLTHQALEAENDELYREVEGLMKRLNAFKIRESLATDRYEAAVARVQELCEANFEMAKRLHRFDRVRGAGGRFVAGRVG